MEHITPATPSGNTNSSNTNPWADGAGTDHRSAWDEQLTNQALATFSAARRLGVIDEQAIGAATLALEVRQTQAVESIAASLWLIAAALEARK